MERFVADGVKDALLRFRELMFLRRFFDAVDDFYCACVCVVLLPFLPLAQRTRRRKNVHGRKHKRPIPIPPPAKARTATVKTPPKTAHVVVKKWYHCRGFSRKTTRTGAGVNENLAAGVASLI
jgi:hypothetical protein